MGAAAVKKQLGLEADSWQLLVFLLIWSCISPFNFSVSLAELWPKGFRQGGGGSPLFCQGPLQWRGGVQQRQLVQRVWLCGGGAIESVGGVGGGGGDITW
jgi:hypothetical protein